MHSVGTFPRENLWLLPSELLGGLLESFLSPHDSDIRCFDEHDEFFDRLPRSTSMRSVSVRISDDEELLSRSFIGKIMSCYPDLKYLKIFSYTQDRGVDIVSRALVALARECPELQELHIPNEIVHDRSALVEFLATAHHLRVFNARDDACFNDAMLLALAQSNGGRPHLEELGMRLELENEETIRQCEATLAHLRRCGEFAPNSAGYATAYACMRNLVDVRAATPHLPQIAEHCPAVRKLTLGVDSWASISNPQDSLLHCFAHTPLLESLDLGDNICPREVVLTGLARHCPNLRSLTAMVPTTGVTTAHLVELMRHCPRLVTLNLYDVGPDAFTDAVLIALAQHSYYLEELRLPQGTCLNDAGLNALVASCKHLRVIQGCEWIALGQRQLLCRQARSRGRYLRFEDGL